MSSELYALFGGLILFFAGFDSYFTERRIVIFGPEIELNPLIHKLSGRIGLKGAILVNTFLPSTFFVAVGWHFELDHALTFYAGMRFLLFVHQLISIKFEEKFKELMRLNKSSGGSDGS